MKIEIDVSGEQFFQRSFPRFQAWYKLCHRDMGPLHRHRGPFVPKETYVWQDPIPAGPALSDADISALKKAVLDSGLSCGQLVGL